MLNTKETQASWHSVTSTQALKLLGTNRDTGLSTQEIHTRQEQWGKNIFEKEKEGGLLHNLLNQFKSPLAIVLLISGLVTLFLGEFLNTIVIFIALAIGIAVGVFQEERASKAFDKLANSQERFATVFRDGRKHVIPAAQLVPGDIIFLESGSYVPADVRLLEASSLQINESALTGEWVAVEKTAETLSKQLPITGRRNMAWMGTLVVAGGGMGLVVATGLHTQIGHVASELTARRFVRTPMQKSIRRLAIFLSYFVLLLVIGIFILGLFRGEMVGELLLLSVAVAVSVIPEGLPAAVTIVLALGMEQILRKGGLVRNLLAAETLGSTTVILTDKTGTLTQAKMQLDSIVGFSLADSNDQEASSDHHTILEAAVRASDAFLESPEGDKGEVVVRGRPMERAIVLAGMTEGISPDDSLFHQEDFLAFESQRRYAASLNRLSGKNKKRVYITGAPETLLACASHVLVHGRKQAMKEHHQTHFLEALKKAGSKGERTLGVAWREVEWERIPTEPKSTQKEEKKKKTTDPVLEKDVVFGGVLIFSDPLRDDVPDAIAAAKGAGTRVIMLTGDNPQTAANIARHAGIAHSNERAYTGDDIEDLSDEKLLDKLRTARVFARVLPSQKLRIAKLLRGNGEIVAMTGDGINDAPALRSAHIGVAVGSGTEVAKEASDLVLLDNSFSIIIAAIEEGRRIIDNLKKIVSHLLATSFGEVFLIGGAILVGLPLPILPVQILWTNIIQEGFLSFALAFEPKERDIMRRGPKRAGKRTILTPAVKKLVFIAGITTGLFIFGLYVVLLHFGLTLEVIRTLMFAGITFSALFFALSLKDFNRPFWQTNLFSNKKLLLALGINVGILVLSLTLPPLRTLLSLVPLTATHIAILIGVALFNILTIEVVKGVIFKK